jgi:hypothetical protein
LFLKNKITNEVDFYWIKSEPMFKNKQKQTKSAILSEKATKELEKMENMDEKEIVLHVQEKILKSSNLSVTDIDLKKLRQMAKNLAFKDDIKAAYINKDFKSVIDFFKILPETKKDSSFLSSKSTGESLTLNDENFDEMDEILQLEQSEKQQIEINEKLKIKLIITEVSHTPKERTVRKILSPFASTLNLSPEFGNY